MIEALYQIGKVQASGSFLEEFVEDIGKGYKHVFKIMFDITDLTTIQYLGIEIEEFDPAKKMKYFYKSKKGNSPDFTPTSKVTTLLKSLKLKRGVFDKMISDNGEKMSGDNKNFISSIEKICTKKGRRIFIDIFNLSRKHDYIQFVEKVTDYKYRDGAIITLGFKKNDEILYVGDIEHFTTPFLSQGENSYKDYYSKYDTISKAENKQCFLCRKNVAKVWGFVNTYNFYTADKEGLVCGGFKQEFAWRNYPVCPDCAGTLSRGKKYIERNLKKRFCSFNYFVVPELIYQDDNLLKKLLERMQKYESFSLEDKKATLIEKVEEAVIRDLAKEDNQINFNFLFYESKNSAFNILLHLQEIAPTRLKFLIETKDSIDNQNRYFDIFKEIKTQKDIVKFDFSFTFLKEFLPNSKYEGNFDKDLLAILNNIFIGKMISADFLYSRFMSKIMPVFLKEGWTEILVLKAYKILLYIEAIKQLERRKINMNNTKTKYDEFFTENPMIDDNVKKTLFLEGVLADNLLKIQYQERKGTPFRSRLNGLKIDGRIAKRLLPEMINKLEEYDKNYYKDLEEAIGEYLIKSDFSKYSIDEMSFYFTLGMTLAKHFKKPEEKTITTENKEKMVCQ